MPQLAIFLRPVTLLSAIAVLALACSSSSSVPEPTRRADGLQDPGLHAIMTQNIERHVESLERALNSQRDDQTVRENTLGVIQSSQNLQLSADFLIAMRPSLPLTADASVIYADRANQLKGFASELEALARAGRVNELRPLVTQVNASCDSCHQLFRTP